MDERELRYQLDRVKAGAVSRRQFTRTMVGLGLTAPLAAQLLDHAGVPRAARAQTRPAFAPTRRGGGGALRVLWWQGPTLLNPHFAAGTKDADGSRIFYEPLAGFDPDGNLVPVLASEIPTLQNGGLARDGRSVTWKLKPGVAWHDGKPFTADDVVFNWEYAADPAAGTVTLDTYRQIERIDKLDSHTVKISFAKPTPFPFEPFCGARGQIVPKHLFEGFRGARSREAPTNLRPVGTGPYRIVDFRPGDAIRAEIHGAYHVPNRPFFDTLELKGGGDAPSAARAVIQTGEYDWAWNMQVEDDILRRMEQGGKGRVEIAPSSGIEHIQLNQSDPWTEVEGERGHVKSTHPLFADPAVRQALALLVDRASIQEQIYGRLGQTTANFLNTPSRFASRATRWEFNVEKASQLLEAAGWKRGADGIRAKDGKRLKLLYQTTINAARQKTQAIVKAAAARAGVDIELKSVVASVYFSTDPANMDTYGHFMADMQMYTTSMDYPDPQSFMVQFASSEISQKENKWQRRNKARFRNEEYDRLLRASEAELDPVKRAANFVRMNDILIQHAVVIPVLWRSNVSAGSLRLKGVDLSGWDGDFWRLPYWHREA
jgi:peptide/nickel transport system substrate-binding protein